MNEEHLRKEATLAVVIWIEEYLTPKAAHDWLWNCTPYPFGLPTDEMLYDGLDVALLVLPLRDLMNRINSDMARWHDEYLEAERGAASP